MTKILVFSDPHGNKKAIESILKDANYDISMCCGDYLVDINYMKQNIDLFVLGNNDWDDHHSDIDIKIEGLTIHMEHGHMIGSYSQLNDKNYMKNYLTSTNYDVLLIGHTHIPLIHSYNNKAIINPGSCAYPRNNSRPSYVILSIDKKNIKSIELHQVKEL